MQQHNILISYILSLDEQMNGEKECSKLTRQLVPLTVSTEAPPICEVISCQELEFQG